MFAQVRTDSGKVQTVHTLTSLISLLSLFSPIAGEGFTCLDHSMLSKKKRCLRKCVITRCDVVALISDAKKKKGGK